MADRAAEDQRLQALCALQVLDSGPEVQFDAVTRMVSAMLDCPIALVSLVDRDRQWFMSATGLPLRETPIELSFCRHAVDARAPLVVPDAQADARFADNALVTGEPWIRAYCGAPLVGRQGHIYGTVCAIDRRPVHWTPAQVALLQNFAAIAAALLETRAVTQDLAETMRELRHAGRVEALVSEIGGVGGWEVALDDRSLRLSPLAARILELPEGAAPSLADAICMVEPEGRAEVAAAVERALVDGVAFRLELPFRTAQGNRRWLLSSGRAEPEGEGGRRFLIGAVQDVTARRLREEELHRAKAELEGRYAELAEAKERLDLAASRDPLTGLLNRRGLLSAYARLSADGVMDRVATLLHIDLDGFKRVNDRYGHETGDALLERVADILRRHTRRSDAIARIGGDEFVILCDGRGHDGDALTIADRIVTEVSRQQEVLGHVCTVGASIGVAEARPDQTDLTELLRNADFALYRAKGLGRGRVQVFDTALADEARRSSRVADELLSALDQRSFLPHYQLQVDAATQTVVGMEALARWRTGTGEILTPGSFLAEANRLSVVDRIDEIVLADAMADFRSLRAQGLRLPRLSVNFSLRNLGSRRFLNLLTELAPERGTLAVELLESVALDDPDPQVLWTIDAMREMGIAIELDDFGSGHSSLVGLLRVRPDAIKIDRLLVEPIVRDPARRKVLRSLVEMVRALDVRVIAEGVETAEHADILADFDCQVLQGYAFSRPAPLAEVAALLARGGVAAA